MKRITTIAMLAALAVGTVSAAFAQTPEPIGLSVRLGALWPSNDAPKNEGDCWFTGGLDYKIKNLNFGNTDPSFSSALSVSLDYYGKGDFSNVPVLLNFVGRKDQFYYSAGAGVAFAKTPDGYGGTDSNLELGYQFSVGFDFTKGQTPVFVEARYQGCGKSDLNGIALYAGIRF